MKHLALALALVACGDNRKPNTPGDASVTPDAAIPLAPCLDRPSDLPRPPIGPLPCDLLPPGFVQETP